MMKNLFFHVFRFNWLSLRHLNFGQTLRSTFEPQGRPFFDGKKNETQLRIIYTSLASLEGVFFYAKKRGDSSTGWV